MATQRSLSAESDGTSVWVHEAGECVARFGKRAFEVYSAGTPRLLVTAAAGAEAEGWLRFEAAVLAEHDFHVPPQATPIRLRRALDVVVDERPDTFMVPLSCLTEFSDPFERDVWGRTPVTRERVARAIAEHDLAAEFVPMGDRHAVAADWDARRVAYFVVHPDEAPIEVEIIAMDGTFEVNDGYHRLAAGIYREDPEIRVTLGGYVSGYDVHFSERRPIGQDGDAIAPGI